MRFDVLVLLPTSSTNLLATSQGPFVATQQIELVVYEVRHSDRGRKKNLPPKSPKRLEVVAMLG